MIEKPGVGAIIQNNLIGPQEARMYDETADTPYTKPAWERATRGAIEQSEIDFPFLFGSTNKKVIPKRGDMLGNLALSITLPPIPGAGILDYWLENVGYILLKKLTLSLNDAEIDSSERLWLSIHDDLFLPDTKRAGIGDMLGTSNLRLSLGHTIIIPLKFFNCYKHGQRQNFLPLLASTTENTLVLEIETESFQNCVTSYGGVNAPVELACELITDYVFLDDMEKEMLVNKPYPVIAEVVQDVEQTSFRSIIDPESGDTVIPTDRVLLDMSEISYPVKYIAFVAYRTDALSQKRYFEYEDIIDRVSLLFDNEEREDVQAADHYSLVQTFKHARRCIPDSVFLYSFAEHAYSSQPNGHFTFSNIRRVSLDVRLKEKRDDIIVKAFVVGYRFIDFQNGTAQVRFV